VIASFLWAFVSLVAIAALYDLANKVIDAFKPIEPPTTGEMIDNTIFAQQIKDLRNDVNALKVTAGFKAAQSKVEAK